MVRNATNATVSDILVEVERPPDRSRLRNELGGAAHSVDVEVTGSGATGTMIENNSAGAWYLETVTLSATSAGNAVTVTLDVKNSSGNVVYSGTTNLQSGLIPFDGVPILSDWSVDYTVTQSDSETYTIEVHPILRQPDPQAVSGGGDDDPVTESQVIDDFEDGGIAEYSGETSSFDVVSGPTFSGSNSLEATGDDAVTGFITSVPGDGLENYPENGDSFRFYVRSTAVGGGSNPHTQEVMFGCDHSANGYSVRYRWHENDNVILCILDEGSLVVLDSEPNATDFVAGRWYRTEVTRGDPIEVGMYDTTDGSQVASLSSTDDTHEEKSGIGYYNRTRKAGETYYYDGMELI